MAQQNIADTITGMISGIKRLGLLYFEKGRLKVTEKITILLATIAFSAVIMALGLVCLVFVSIGIGHLLATTIAPHLAYLIIAAFYLIFFGLAIILRRKLFVDPISRFMSRLLVEEPEDERAQRLMSQPPKQPAGPDAPTHKTPRAPHATKTTPVNEMTSTADETDDEIEEIIEL